MKTMVTPLSRVSLFCYPNGNKALPFSLARNSSLPNFSLFCSLTPTLSMAASSQSTAPLCSGTLAFIMITGLLGWLQAGRQCLILAIQEVTHHIRDEWRPKSPPLQWCYARRWQSGRDQRWKRNRAQKWKRDKGLYLLVARKWIPRSHALPIKEKAENRAGEEEQDHPEERSQLEKR